MNIKVCVGMFARIMCFFIGGALGVHIFVTVIAIIKNYQEHERIFDMKNSIESNGCRFLRRVFKAKIYLCIY